MNIPTVAEKSDLDTVNPVDHAKIFVESEKRIYCFDYTDTTTPVNDDTVLLSGNYGHEHPTHADQPFMQGRWLCTPMAEVDQAQEPETDPEAEIEGLAVESFTELNGPDSNNAV